MIVVGGALLSPLVHETALLRIVADFFALGIALAATVTAVRALRGAAGEAAQQDEPVAISSLSPGAQGTVAGPVITPAEQPSRASDDRFVAILASVVRLDDNIGAQSTRVLSECVGRTLEVRDGTGVAEVRLDGMLLYGTLHRTLEWEGEGLASVPDEPRLREALAGVRHQLVAPPTQRKRKRPSRLPRFRYTEIVIREGDELVVTGDVLELTEQPGPAKGYRENVTEWRAVLAGSTEAPVRIRSVSPAVVARMKRRAKKTLAVAFGLAAWGVAVWFLPALL